MQLSRVLTANNFGRCKIKGRSGERPFAYFPSSGGKIKLHKLGVVSLFRLLLCGNIVLNKILTLCGVAHFGPQIGRGVIKAACAAVKPAQTQSQLCFHKKNAEAATHKIRYSYSNAPPFCQADNTFIPLQMRYKGPQHRAMLCHFYKNTTL